MVVTGSAGGLGGAVVRALVGAGAACVLPVRRATDSPPPGAQVIAGVDLTDEDAVRQAYASMPALWASVHLAGGWAGGPIPNTTLTDLQRQLDINFVSAFLCCREAVRNMRAKAAGRGGRIINVSSRAALVPAGGAIAYAASKAAVNTLTQALADEVRDDGILVNAIAPSTIDTPANRAAMPQADPGRWAQPADIAATIVSLLSPENRLASGAIIPVYGQA